MRTMTDAVFVGNSISVDQTGLDQEQPLASHDVPNLYSTQHDTQSQPGLFF